MSRKIAEHQGSQNHPPKLYRPSIGLIIQHPKAEAVSFLKESNSHGLIGMRLTHILPSDRQYLRRWIRGLAGVKIIFPHVDSSSHEGAHAIKALRAHIREKHGKSNRYCSNCKSR